jgi:hypothetical protein
MGAELGRLREGKSTRTGMSESQLRDFARKPSYRTERPPRTESRTKSRRGGPRR